MKSHVSLQVSKLVEVHRIRMLSDNMGVAQSLPDKSGRLLLSLGKFGRNQQLDGSISLSPLYPSSTINLHVRIAADLHQSFPWLRPTQA